MSILDDLNERLPLTVTGIEWNDPTLVMHGAGWGFNTMSAWRIWFNGEILTTPVDPDASTKIGKLANLAIDRVSIQNISNPIDPVFHFGEMAFIEIFSTEPYDTWSISIDNDWLGLVGQLDMPLTLD